MSVAFVLFQADAAASLDNGGLFTGEQFRKDEVAQSMMIYDMGVADIDDDGWLDVHTTNHYARPLMLINQRNGRFADKVVDLHLGTDRGQWGAEAGWPSEPPAFEHQGLYVYWDGNDLVIRAHDIAATDPATGFVLMGKKRSTTTFGNAVTEASPVADLIGRVTPALEGTWEFGTRFRVDGDGAMHLKAAPLWDARPSAPVTVHIDGTFPLSRVFVGATRDTPVAPTITLRPDDRHAMAWFDWDGDGRSDVMTVSGGDQGRLHGRLEVGHGSYRLFRQANGRFWPTSAGEDLERFGCSSRDISLVDVNRDGRLDVYQVCGRVLRLENQLFEQSADRAFHEVGAAKGLNLQGEGRTAWLDVDLDGDMDLVWATKRDLWLYRNRDGVFDGQLLGPTGVPTAQIAVDDFDLDGDLDLFLAAPSRSKLLVNDGGTLVLTDPERAGLPTDAICATWVDYDNDGLTDLHVLPGGLFRQAEEGAFQATGLLRADGPMAEAHCSWADFNNDGFPDLMVAQPLKRPKLQVVADNLRKTSIVRSTEDYLGWFPLYKPILWSLTLYANVGGNNGWLDLQLVGRDGNSPAIGSLVRLHTASGVQTHQVGHLDGGQKSVGHYRVYFGLGAKAGPPDVEIQWPDGARQTLAAPGIDELLVVRQDRAAADLAPVRPAHAQ